jgi:hypothetical protein
MVTVVKAAGVLGEYTYQKAEFWCASLWAKGLNVKNIHKQMFPVFVA